MPGRVGSLNLEVLSTVEAVALDHRPAISVGLPSPNQAPNPALDQTKRPMPGSGVFQNIATGTLHIGGDFVGRHSERTACGKPMYDRSVAGEPLYLELSGWPDYAWPLCKQCESTWDRFCHLSRRG